MLSFNFIQQELTYASELRHLRRWESEKTKKGCIFSFINQPEEKEGGGKRGKKKKSEKQTLPKNMILLLMPNQSS